MAREIYLDPVLDDKSAAKLAGAGGIAGVGGLAGRYGGLAG